MATEVSFSLVRRMDGCDSNDSASTGKSTAPIITRDLLGGRCTVDSKELDLDLQVPCGWEKRLDLKSGKVYLHRSNSSNTSSSTSETNHPQTITAKSNLQDLNFPPSSSSKQILNLFDDSALDLKLDSSPNHHSSICTLDKVKSALERAAANKEIGKKKRDSVSMSKSCSSNSSSSIKESSDFDQEEKSSGGLFAAGCPNCLLYVLVARNYPKCPRCNCDVPAPMPVKKPRIDLNISI